MPKAKRTVTLPDGTVATRTTANPYTHVVAARVEADPSGTFTVGEWVAMTWTTQPAQALARESRRYGPRPNAYQMFVDFRVIELADLAPKGA